MRISQTLDVHAVSLWSCFLLSILAPPPYYELISLRLDLFFCLFLATWLAVNITVLRSMKIYEKTIYPHSRPSPTLMQLLIAYSNGTMQSKMGRDQEWPRNQAMRRQWVEEQGSFKMDMTITFLYWFVVLWAWVLLCIQPLLAQELYFSAEALESVSCTPSAPCSWPVDYPALPWDSQCQQPPLRVL